MARRFMAAVIVLGVLLVPGLAPTASAQSPDPDSPGDYVLPTSPDEMLTPPTQFAEPQAVRLWGDASEVAGARIKYALSYVVLPIKGYRLGFSKSRVRSMTKRVAARMADQTDNRISYGFGGWRVAPKSRANGLTCNVEKLHRTYRRYAKGLKNPPPGYNGTIAVYLTPPRYKCPFYGVALLGGKATYLNGLDLRDPQRLQDWITAHELGHNLGLVHSSSFWPKYANWSIATDRIPVDRRGQSSDEYGDYLDVMGQPPNQGFQVRGAHFGNWTIDGINLSNLGVLTRGDVFHVRRSGTYSIAALSPQGSPQPSLIAIPVVSDHTRSYWIIEYRPPIQSQQSGIDYPEPWLTRGYGVRLISQEHSNGRYYSNNQAFHRSRGPRAFSQLPVHQPIRLAGGTTVEVTGVDNATAQLDIHVSP